MKNPWLRRVDTACRAHWSEIVTAAVLLTSFFFFYMYLVHSYRGLAGYFNHDNVLFGIDHTEALDGWVDYHKGVHPLILLISVPAGKILEWIFGSYLEGMAVFAAGAGAAAATGVFLLLRQVTGRISSATAIAVFFGVSMSQMIHGGIADTYELVILSLLPTYALTIWCLRDEKLRLPYWIGAGLCAFSITITSTLQTALCMAVVLFATRRKGSRLGPFLKMVALVTMIGTALSLLQWLLIPDAKLYYLPETFEREMRYTSMVAIERPGLVLSELFKTFFLFSWVGQMPRDTLYEAGTRVNIVYYKVGLQYGFLAWSAVLLWLGLWTRGVVRNLRDKSSRRVFLAAALCVLANIAIHSVYGTRELFLYSPHFTTAFLLLGIGPRGVSGKVVLGCWWSLVLLTAWVNLGVVRELLAAYP